MRNVRASRRASSDLVMEIRQVSLELRVLGERVKGLRTLAARLESVEKRVRTMEFFVGQVRAR